MGLVVTGLSPSGDMNALKAALREAGVPPDDLQVVGPEDGETGVRRGGLAGDDIAGSNYGSGTTVPGLTNQHRGRGYFRSEGLDDRLGDFEIPESELDNYLEAIERGRSVVAYFATNDSAGRVEEAFRAANLTNVRRY
ncbi:MAG: hypothetical protein M3R44_03475 [Candidatus Eremiobacteraeota bacterium]|nr:hypothetical protein [Candidatus Eremiobacteraeota bacterium]